MKYPAGVCPETGRNVMEPSLQNRNIDGRRQQEK